MKNEIRSYRPQPDEQPNWERAYPWTTAQNRIAFVANAAGNWDIYVVHADGSKSLCLTEEPVDGLFSLDNVAQFLEGHRKRGPVMLPDADRPPT